MDVTIPPTDLQLIADALEAAGVFATPAERLRHWGEYKEDAATRLIEARRVLAKHGAGVPRP